MFGVSLSDRLKATLNQLEQTGSQLQQRAISATQPAQAAAAGPAASSSPRPASPASPTRPKVTPAAGASDSPLSPGPSTSPTKSSTSHLAESAIGNLRRSLQLQRESLDLSRPGSAELKEVKESKEIKEADAPTIAVAASSRPETPKGLAAPFALGSLASSAQPSGKATPGDVSDADESKGADGKTADPLSVPLPASPATSPAKEQADPLRSAGAAEVKEKAAEPEAAASPKAAEPEAVASPQVNGDTTPDADATVEQKLDASERRFKGELVPRLSELTPRPLKSLHRAAGPVSRSQQDCQRSYAPLWHF